jgi:hypothetical protein
MAITIVDALRSCAAIVNVTNSSPELRYHRLCHEPIKSESTSFVEHFRVIVLIYPELTFNGINLSLIHPRRIGEVVAASIAHALLMLLKECYRQS